MLHIMKQERIAVAGSAANPITRGHEEFAEALTRSGLFDLILWFPSGMRADKPDLVPPEHRVRMTELVFDEAWRSAQPTEFRIDTREALRRSIPTIELLREVSKEYPDREIVFATGVDVLAPRPEYGGLSDVKRYWVEGKTLLSDWTFAVFPREGYPDPRRLARDGELPARTLFLERPPSPFGGISSTEVRRRVKAGEPYDDLVHPAVLSYIRSTGLYRSS
jgi:nicotinate-nucleotide adenylyltransferase